MSNCSRSFDSTRKSNGLPLTAVETPSSHGSSLTAADNNSQHRFARARRVFVAALAEWVNMHDYHEPFPDGPPGVHQSCATEDNGRLKCNKMYPRKTMRPTKECPKNPADALFFRLWLARN